MLYQRPTLGSKKLSQQCLCLVVCIIFQLCLLCGGRFDFRRRQDTGNFVVGFIQKAHFVLIILDIKNRLNVWRERRIRTPFSGHLQIIRFFGDR